MRKTSIDRRFKQHGRYVGIGRGKDRTPTVRTWASMIVRCTNPKDVGFALYGGRGITLDVRWLDFSNFLSDMGERPQGYTLDRIDSNLGYFKDNCRWACLSRQAHNRRDNKLSWEKVDRIRWMRDEGFSQRQIAAEFGVAQSTIMRVLNGRSWKPELPVVKPEDGTPRTASQ